MHKKIAQIILVAGLICFFVLSTRSTNAQSFRDRFIRGIGTSVCTELFFGPESMGEDSSLTRGTDGISLYTFTYLARFNLMEFSGNSALALDIPAAAGISGGEYGSGHINIPVMLSFNYGNISTYSSDKNNGFGIGVGMEYYMTNIFKRSEYYYEESMNVKNSFIQPVMHLSYRCWSKFETGREYNLKLGYKPGKEFKTEEGTGDDGSLSVKFTVVVYPKF